MENKEVKENKEDDDEEVREKETERRQTGQPILFCLDFFFFY